MYIDQATITLELIHVYCPAIFWHHMKLYHCLRWHFRINLEKIQTPNSAKRWYCKKNNPYNIRSCIVRHWKNAVVIYLCSSSERRRRIKKGHEVHLNSLLRIFTLFCNHVKSVQYNAHFSCGTAERRMLPMIFCWVPTVQMQDSEIIFLGPKLFAAEQVYVAIYRIKSCHTAHETLTVLQGPFPGRVISCFVNQNWPPGSCDLTPTNFFCGVFLSFRLLHTLYSIIETFTEEFNALEWCLGINSVFSIRYDFSTLTLHFALFTMIENTWLNSEGTEVV